MGEGVTVSRSDYSIDGWMLSLRSFLNHLSLKRNDPNEPELIQDVAPKFPLLCGFPRPRRHRSRSLGLPPPQARQHRNAFDVRLETD